MYNSSEEEGRRVFVENNPYLRLWTYDLFVEEYGKRITNPFLW